jgi:hypothetical protein
MKNIHVLSTNKQSRLWTNNLKRRLELDEFYSKHQTNLAKHIYITSDELTKEGYMYDIDGDVGKAIGSDMKEFEGNKKIILTTDLDLIADGVQAIDDEFLEWFIKNPSCELIEIQCRYNFYAGQDLTHYKIIIPKEESKQYFYCSDRLELDENERCVTQCNHCASKPKQRLEEAGLKHCDMLDEFPALVNPLFSFKKGVEWQQKRSYSEEEAGELVYNIIGEYAKEYGITIDGAKLNDLFNQLKKQ